MKILRLALALIAFCGAPAAAQNFPQLSGRVVDAANLLDAAQEQALTARLDALERATSRQLVVATIPDLGGYPIADYGYQLGRHWRIGQGEANNGAILIVAPNDRKVRIEVGYGLEPILTDAFANRLIDERILPRFRENDFAGGIAQGVEAIVGQLSAPPEEAERRAVAAAQAEARQREQRAQSGGGTSILGVVFWIVILVFVIGAMGRRGRRGRRYGTRRRHRGWGSSPVIIWGGGDWGGGGGFGGGGGGFGGFGGSGGGGFGGFSGGGGSFGGGGASGSW
jgi:uncharacterized protein